MTREEFIQLKPGDRILGRSNGEGMVIAQNDSLYIKWEGNNIITFPLHQLCSLWRCWTASPMKMWKKL